VIALGGLRRISSFCFLLFQEFGFDPLQLNSEDAKAENKAVFSQLFLRVFAPLLFTLCCSDKAPVLSDLGRKQSAFGCPYLPGAYPEQPRCRPGEYLTLIA